MLSLLEALAHALAHAYALTHASNKDQNALTARGALISSCYTHLHVPYPGISYVTCVTVLTTAHVALSTGGSIYEHL
jgi:hypothetical protein